MVNLPAKHVVNDSGHTTDHNTIIDALTALTLGVGGPTSVTRARIHASSAQAFANNTWVAVSMDVTEFDSDGLHSATTNSRFVIAQAGTYEVEGGMFWDSSNVTGARIASIFKNGVSGGVELARAEIYPNQSAGTGLVVVSGPVQLAAGDYIELGGFQTSGVSLSTFPAGGPPAAWLGIRRVDAGNVAYATGGSQLIGRTVYNPAAAVGPTTTSTTLVAVDATNLTVTFTAPASGSVVVRLSAEGNISAGTTFGYDWGLLNASGGAQVGPAVLVAGSGPTTATRLAVTIPITGLTAGQVYTLQWAHAVENATVTGRIAYGGGGGGNTSTVGGYGPAVIEVYDGTVGTPNNSFPQNGITQPFLAMVSSTVARAWATTAAATVDVDATNLKVTFIAPASGQVLVRLSGLGYSAGGASELLWCLRDLSNNIITTVGVDAVAGSSTAYRRAEVPLLVTGLTPGQSYTWKWSMFSGSTGTVGTWSGGPSDPSTMMVQDAVLSPNMTAQSPNPFLLGQTTYLPGGVTGIATTTVASSTIDATNLKVTFIAPASGRVLVKLSAYAQIVSTLAGGGLYLWVLRDANGDVVGTQGRVGQTGNTSIGGLRGAPSIPVSGLTPGQQYTWFWGHSVDATTTTGTIYMGGSLGPASMEVWDGTAGQGVVVTPPGLTTLGRLAAHLAANTAALTSGTWTTLTGWTIDDDPLGKYDAANNRWVAPATATYDVSLLVQFSASASATGRGAAILVNGAQVRTAVISAVSDGSNNTVVALTEKLRLNAGDVVSFQAQQLTGANTLTVAGAASAPWRTSVSIEQLPDTSHAPSVVSASQVIGARVYLAATIGLAAINTYYKTSWDTLDFDNGGFWASSTPTRLTVPAGAGGYYRLKAKCTGQAGSGSLINIEVWRNGNNNDVVLYETEYCSVTGQGNWMTVGGDRIIKVNPGDYFEMALTQSNYAGSQIIGSTTLATTYMELVRENSVALTDPTNSTGDIPVRSSSGALARLAAGADTAPLVADSSQALGVRYDNAAWADWVPTIAGVPATVTSARYKQRGKSVEWEIYLTLTGAATTTITATLPVTAKTNGAHIGSAFGQNTANQIGIVLLTDVNTMFFLSSISWSNSGPGTWANGSLIRASGRYEAA